MFTITRPTIGLELAVSLLPIANSDRCYADISGVINGQAVTFKVHHFAADADAQGYFERWPDEDYLALLSPDDMEAIERRSFADIPEF